VTLAILARQGGLVAVDKPAGLLVIPGRAEAAEPCAVALLEAQLGQKVWVCHRIDRDTSGVLLFATDAAAHRAASMAFERGEVSKRYLALVQGRVLAPLDIELALVEARRRKMRVALPGELGKASRTLVRPREVFARASLVECEPLSGRQHQLRVHLRARGHPLLVDHQYGRREPLTARDLGGTSEQVVLDRTPLHALWLAIPALGLEVTSALPADLEATLAVLRAGASTPAG
jgi:23S rRNA-/tRNA-specific pseudouridylate synthase